MLIEKGSNCKKCKHYKKGRTRKPCAECSEIFNSNYEFDTKQMLFKKEATCTFTMKITPDNQDKSKAYFSVIMPDGKKIPVADSEQVYNSMGFFDSCVIHRFIEILFYGLSNESQHEDEGGIS